MILNGVNALCLLVAWWLVFYYKELGCHNDFKWNTFFVFLMASCNVIKLSIVCQSELVEDPC